jgi:two-component system, NtrC family, sensor kinase
MENEKQTPLRQAFFAFLAAAAGLVGAALLFTGIIPQRVWWIALIGSVWGIAILTACRFWRLSRQTRTPDPLPLEQHQDEFMRTVSLIVGFEELLNNLVDRISTWVGTKRIAILTANTRVEAYTVRGSLGFAGEELANVVLQDDARLVKWLNTNETYLIPSEHPEVLDYLKPEEKELLEKFSVEVVFPLVAANRLVGIIFVSSGENFNRERIEAIWRSMPQIALAVENATLYAQQGLRMRRLYRTERLATTGQLAAGAAHEIRNPLASIRSTIQFFKGRLAQEPEGAEMVADLLEETDRINAIVEGMLSFSRPTEPHLANIDIAEMISQTMRLLEPTARKSHVEIRTHFPSEPALVRADADQLKQVFLNVAMNALQAMPEGGELTILISRWSTAADRPAWKAEFADTGAGIAPEDLENVFDPFFTTKRDGTGLGLSICHSIIQAHGGEIEVESTLGQGTRVDIHL